MFPEPIDKLLQMMWAVTPVAVVLVGWKVRKLTEHASELTKQLAEILDRLHEMPVKRVATETEAALRAIEEQIKETNCLLREAAQKQA